MQTSENRNIKVWFAVIAILITWQEEEKLKAKNDLTLKDASHFTILFTLAVYFSTDLMSKIFIVRVIQ